MKTSKRVHRAIADPVSIYLHDDTDFAPNVTSIPQVHVILGDRPNTQLQPLVAPHVSHFSQVPLRTIVKFWHSVHMLPV